MYHQEFSPPEELQDTIKCFWYHKRDLETELTSFEVVPDGYTEIIFHFGNGCSISINGNWEPLPSPFLIGLLQLPVHFSSKHRLDIIGIRCFPWTVFDLLGLQSVKGATHVFEHPIAQLQPTLQQLINTGKIKEAVTELEKYFLQARSGIETDSMLFKAGIAMRKAKGTLPVNKVATAAHATVRTLERKFKESSGHTVKDVSGLMRFEQVRNQLWLHPDSNLAGLAHELGYTDQAHLSREFKRYSGTTPAAFARKGKKQNFGNDFIAFT